MLSYSLTKVTKTLQVNTENLLMFKKTTQPPLLIWKRFSVSNQKPDKNNTGNYLDETEIPALGQTTQR